MADILSCPYGVIALQMGRAGARRAHVRVRNAGEKDDTGQEITNSPARQLLRTGAVAHDAALHQKGEETDFSDPWMPRIIARAPTLVPGRLVYAQGLANTRYADGKWQPARGPHVLHTGGVARWQFVRDGKEEDMAARRLLRAGQAWRSGGDLVQEPFAYWRAVRTGFIAAFPRLIQDNGWIGNREPVRFAWNGLLQARDLSQSGYNHALYIGGAGDSSPPQVLEGGDGRGGRNRRIAARIRGVAVSKAVQDRSPSHANGWNLANHRLLRIGEVAGARVLQARFFWQESDRRPLAIGGAEMNRAFRVKAGVSAHILLRFGYKKAAHAIGQQLLRAARQPLRIGAAGPVHNSTASKALKQHPGSQALRFAMPAPQKLYHGNYSQRIEPPPDNPLLPRYHPVPHRHVVRVRHVPGVNAK